MAEFINHLYQFSPIWAQQIMVAVYGVWWYRRRFGPPFQRLLAEFNARERWTAEQFQAYQERQLQKVLEAAWRTPYYRLVFKEVGITQNAPPFEVLKQLPFLSKETLRTRAKDLLSQNPPPKGTIVFKSSGTTGTPTEIYYTRQFQALEIVMGVSRNLHWANTNHRERRVMFGVRKVCRYDQNKPPFWRFSPVENMAYASIYHLSPKFLPYYLDFLDEYHPAVIMGYPSALQTVAHFALENGKLPPPAKLVVTTSETFIAQARRVIETAWQCRVYDRYGAVEGCLLASQCEYGRYHVSPDVGIIEIVNQEGQPCPPNVLGEIVCTGLQNILQPLIRYRIGDAARWASQQQCPCGRAMPILEAIEGRLEDICYTPDGRQMLRFDTVFKGVENIREAQVVQERLDLFSISVIPANGFNKNDVEQIKNNMRLHVGNVETHVKPVSFIARTSSGKFRAVICNLPREQKEMLQRRRNELDDLLNLQDLKFTSRI
jgi:phenylacetate-CoA ligase